MVTAKKKKGKQRKAAKVNNESGINRADFARLSRGIRKAREDATTTVLVTSGADIDRIIIESIPTVLRFLKCSRNYTFEKVMLATETCTWEEGGDLKSPVTWISILRRVVFQGSDSNTLTVAKNIGILVKCMCNDTNRLFYKSNKHWREGIGEFVGLVSDMVSKSIGSTDRKVVDTLLNHEGLLSSIMQWGFWKEYRPDIVKEVGTEICSRIVSIGGYLISTLIGGAAFQMRDGEGLLTKKGTSLLQAFGSTPIVSKSFDDSCMVSCMAGLVRAIQDHFRLAGWDRDEFKNFLRVILPLVDEADCVDKGVITEVVDLGLNVTLEYSSAELLTEVSFAMLCPYPNNPSDSRVAFAIRAGLVEMCLSLVDRFGIVGMGDPLLFKNIHHIFQNIYEISLHEKTAKAIRSKKTIIQEKLVSLEQIRYITRSTKCKELLDMVRSILSLNGSYCCRCKKSMSRTEVKQCSGCRRMSYCSSACQREDWLNGGHKLTCCKLFTDEKAGQFQGRFEPLITTQTQSIPVPVPKNDRAVAKLKELEANLNMIQLKLFLDHSDTILSQAKSLQLPLYGRISERV